MNEVSCPTDIYRTVPLVYNPGDVDVEDGDAPHEPPRIDHTVHSIDREQHTGLECFSRPAPDTGGAVKGIERSDQASMPE